jgi:hypothetical protein
MKNIFCLLLTGVFFLIVSGPAHAFECGRLTAIGDPSFKVLQSCGEPIAKEVVGYTLTQDRKRELKMEHWVCGPEAGFYYIFIFEGGILTKKMEFHK